MNRLQMDHEFAITSQACEKYLLGELSPGLRDAYEEHYFDCAECATQLRIAADVIGASQQIFSRTSVITESVPATRALRGWFAWWRPAIALPVLATLLLILGYQNLVTIPQFKTVSAPRVLPMFSLISSNTRGESPLVFTAHRNEPIGLYVDIPFAPSYQAYDIKLQDPGGKIMPLSSLTYGDAQKTQVVRLTPLQAGNYSLIILGQPRSPAQPAGAPPVELAHMQFTIALD
jgi:Putative zinc-finger